MPVLVQGTASLLNFSVPELPRLLVFLLSDPPLLLPAIQPVCAEFVRQDCATLDRARRFLCSFPSDFQSSSPGCSALHISQPFYGDFESCLGHVTLPSSSYALHVWRAYNQRPDNGRWFRRLCTPPCSSQPFQDECCQPKAVQVGPFDILSCISDITATRSEKPACSGRRQKTTRGSRPSATAHSHPQDHPNETKD